VALISISVTAPAIGMTGAGSPQTINRPTPLSDGSMTVGVIMARIVRGMPLSGQIGRVAAMMMPPSPPMTPHPLMADAIHQGGSGSYRV
jgi:hypothetical protein